MAEVAERVAANLVTSENLTAFNADRLRLDVPKAVEPAKVEITEPVKEPVKEEVKEEEVIQAKDILGEKPKKTHPIQERFSEMAEKRRIAEEEAAKAREEAAQARKEADEWKQKLQPPKAPDDPGEKPTLAQFENNADKWGDALIEWHRKTDAKKQAEQAQKDYMESRQRTMAERVAKAKEELPDILDKIATRKDVKITDIMEDAIYEAGEDGPRIIYHLIDNLEEINRISRLSPASQVRAIDAIAAKLKPAKKEEVKTEPKAEKAEPSKAPKPIEPVKAIAGGEVQDKIDAKGEFTGTAKEWKMLRKAGKIS